MQLLDEEINAITKNVWSSTFGIEPYLNNRSVVSSDNNGDFLVGHIKITGAWNGSVIIKCSVKLAYKIAAIWCEIKSEEVSINDILETVKELTNIISGHIKSLLPAPNKLSLPEKIEWNDYYKIISTSSVLNQMTFACENEPFGIVILQNSNKVLP